VEKIYRALQFVTKNEHKTHTKVLLSNMIPLHKCKTTNKDFTMAISRGQWHKPSPTRSSAVVVTFHFWWCSHMGKLYCFI